MFNIEFSTEQLTELKGILDYAMENDEDEGSEFYPILNKIETALGEDLSENPYTTQEIDEDESEDGDESGDLEDDE